jgi:hypothetical protein
VKLKLSILISTVEGALSAADDFRGAATITNPSSASAMIPECRRDFSFPPMTLCGDHFPVCDRERSEGSAFSPAPTKAGPSLRSG